MSSYHNREGKKEGLRFSGRTYQLTVAFPNAIRIRWGNDALRIYRAYNVSNTSGVGYVAREVNTIFGLNLHFMR